MRLLFVENNILFMGMAICQCLESFEVVCAPAVGRGARGSARDGGARLASRLEGETLTAATVLAYLRGVRLRLHGKPAVAKSFPGF